MTAIEPNITWVHEAAATSTGNSVSLFTAATNSDFVYLQGLSKDGYCYTVVQVNNPGITTPATGYNEGAGYCLCGPDRLCRAGCSIGWQGLHRSEHRLDHLLRSW